MALAHVPDVDIRTEHRILRLPRYWDRRAVLLADRGKGPEGILRYMSAEIHSLACHITCFSALLECRSRIGEGGPSAQGVGEGDRRLARFLDHSSQGTVRRSKAHGGMERVAGLHLRVMNVEVGVMLSLVMNLDKKRSS